MSENLKMLRGEELFRVAKKEQKALGMVADYLSYLCLMMVQRANSGHPGLPLGCSLAMSIFYRYFFRYADAQEIRRQSAIFRDRFVLSAGHGSALQYALQSVFGQFFTEQDLASFRSLHSLTPGHPEYDLPKGIETTTGPLGQGFANAVGLALGGKMLDARVPKKESLEKKNLFDYRVFTLLGDGCMMEGVTHEAASLAGHLGLDNFIAIYDSNNISIDGDVGLAMSENIRGKFEALGYQVFECDGHDFMAIVEIFDAMLHQPLAEMSEKSKPKLLILHTTIGQGLKDLEGTRSAHGAPAGIPKIVEFLEKRSFLTLPVWQKFAVLSQKEKENFLHQQLKSGHFFGWDAIKNDIKKATSVDFYDWDCGDYFAEKYDDLQKMLVGESEATRFFKALENSGLAQKKIGDDEKDLADQLKKYEYSPKKGASRVISGDILQIVAEKIPYFVGGSADLVLSTHAHINDSPYVAKNDFGGRNVAYGIREHAMAAVGNGLALSFPFVPFSSTFFSFVDYLRPSIRLSALMRLKHLYIFTHDSYAVGEDGPTHQPIEQLNSLRLTPHLNVFRPGDDQETAWGYLYFISHDEPVVLVLSRQAFFSEVFEKSGGSYENFLKGGYVYKKESKKDFQLVIVASGYELGVALKVRDIFEREGRSVRVVSMPSPNFFMRQEKEYIHDILGFSSEKAGLVYLDSCALGPFCFKERPDGRTWYKSLEDFGLSGSQKDLEKHLGYDPENLAIEIKKALF